jgi:hypothetical protein
MARTLSLAALQGALAAETDELYLALLQVDHTDLGTPLRFVNNSDNVTSGGNVYTAFPFEVRMPDDTEDKEPTAELRIDNVSREIMDEVRSIASPPEMTLSVVLESSPNTIEWGPLVMDTRGVSYDANVITFRLAYSSFIREPFPYIAFDPVNFPGMFQ